MNDTLLILFDQMTLEEKREVRDWLDLNIQQSEDESDG